MAPRPDAPRARRHGPRGPSRSGRLGPPAGARTCLLRGSPVGSRIPASPTCGRETRLPPTGTTRHPEEARPTALTPHRPRSRSIGPGSGAVPGPGSTRAVRSGARRSGRRPRPSRHRNDRTRARSSGDVRTGRPNRPSHAASSRTLHGPSAATIRSTSEPGRSARPTARMPGSSAAQSARTDRTRSTVAGNPMRKPSAPRKPWMRSGAGSAGPVGPCSRSRELRNTAWTMAGLTDRRGAACARVARRPPRLSRATFAYARGRPR